MSSIIPIFASFLIGALLVAVSIPIIVRVSKAKNLVDVPNERKVNKTVIPNLGGVALFFGISVSSLLCIYQYDFKDLRYVIFAMIVMFFIGIKDDILDISARKKFMVQFFTSFVLIILGDIRFTNLHGVLGIYEINYFLSIVISSVAIVGIMNAVNLIDGIDGLASLLGLLISSFLWWDQVPYAVMSFAVAGSLGAFFFYNVLGRKNKIFMGDTGSLILGCLFSIFVIKFNNFALNSSEWLKISSPAISMAVISIPLFDMLRVFALRILQGKSPFYPDKNHIHHKLLNLGYSHLKSSVILFISNIVLIAIVFACADINNNLQLVMLMSFAALFSAIPGLLKRFSSSSVSSEPASSKISIKIPLASIPDVSTGNIDLFDLYAGSSKKKSNVKFSYKSGSEIEKKEKVS
jgi:UDP-GlcNAc:undecaprenyl-phosphate/decaprenyl-phosphate GlcNAc-1-phosphate transferase